MANNKSPYTYNTEQPLILIKTYGRIIQQLAQKIAKVPDCETRTKMAHDIIPIMKKVSNTSNMYTRSTPKLWQDLFTMTNHEIDVKPPCELATSDPLPSSLQLPRHRCTKPLHKRYGRYLSALMQKVASTTDQELQATQLTILLRTVRLLRRHEYDPTLILQHITSITGKKMKVDLEEFKKKLPIPSTTKFPCYNKYKHHQHRRRYTR